MARGYSFILTYVIVYAVNDLNESRDSFYDKLLGYIRSAKDKFGLFRESRTSEEPSKIEDGRVTLMHDFYLPRGVSDTLTFTPLSSVAYLDPDINRFRDAETGLLLSGPQYRAKVKFWRGKWLGELLESRFPHLTPDQRAERLRRIAEIRESDKTTEEKDAAIRAEIGSP